MNICITNVDSKPEYIGGIKRVSSILAREWCRAGHKVYFLSLCRSDLRIGEIAGTPQFFLPDPVDETNEKNIIFFSQFIRKYKIDIVLHQHLEEWAVSALCFKVRDMTHVKLVIAYHFAPTHNLDIVDSCFYPSFVPGSLGIRLLKDMIMQFRWRLWRRKAVQNELELYFSYCLENCDRMVLLSKHFIPVMNELTGNVYRGKILSICNPPVFNTDFAIPPKSKTVLWCGRVEYGMKRVDRMLHIWKRVVARHPDWNCVIMGSGNIGLFRMLADRYHIPNLVFTGFCNPEEYYRQGAVLCLTSSSEGWGLVLVEAMAYGVVPVAYDSFASLCEIVEDGQNGYRVPAFDEKKFVEKLELLMDDSSLREKLAKAGSNSIEKYDLSEIAGEWIKQFECVINGA